MTIGHEGEVPHWNPHQHMGEPTIGTIQPAPFYPVYTLVRLCTRVFGTPVEYFPACATLLHFGIAGFGWYCLLRLFDIRPAIALLGSVSGATSRGPPFRLHSQRARARRALTVYRGLVGTG